MFSPFASLLRVFKSPRGRIVTESVGLESVTVPV